MVKFCDCKTQNDLNTDDWMPLLLLLVVFEFSKSGDLRIHVLVGVRDLLQTCDAAASDCCVCFSGWWKGYLRGKPYHIGYGYVCGGNQLSFLIWVILISWQCHLCSEFKTIPWDRRRLRVARSIHVLQSWQKLATEYGARPSQRRTASDSY